MRNENNGRPVLPSGDVRPNFPWGRSVLVTLVVIFVAVLILQLSPIAPVLGIGLIVHYLKAAYPAVQAWTVANKGLVSMILEEICYLFSFAMVILYLRGKVSKTTPLADLVGGRWAGFSLRSTFRHVVIAFFAMNVVTTLLYKLLPLPTPYSPAGALGAQLHGVALIIFAIGACIVAPIAEEIVFRGFVLNMLRAAFANSFAGRIGINACNYISVVISAAIFAGIHGTLTGFLPLFIVGIALAEVYRRTGSIYASMTLHCLNNVMATLSLLAGH